VSILGERERQVFYINNCPARCKTKQSIYYSASSLYTFRVSTTPIMSTQNCNYSLQYWSCYAVQLLSPTWQSVATLEGGAAQKKKPVSEVVVTVLCIPSDGFG